MNALIVLERTVQVHHSLLDAGIDNAVGGALALGYHIDEPRLTQDIDLNVSLPASRASEALAALPPGVPWDASTLEAIQRDDQVRIRWPAPDGPIIPLDLFFAADTLHDVVRGRTVTVPMLDSTIKVLSATDLTIFKALFDRPKDWLDIQAMLEAHDSTVDLRDVVRWVGSIVGDDDARVARLRQLAGPD